MSYGETKAIDGPQRGGVIVRRDIAMRTPADMLFERAILQREQARNQLRVALSALEELDNLYYDVPGYIALITRGALDAVQQMQDEASDRSDAVPAGTPEMAALSVAPAVQQTVDPVGPSSPTVGCVLSPRPPADGSAGQHSLQRKDV